MTMMRLACLDCPRVNVGTAMVPVRKNAEGHLVVDRLDLASSSWCNDCGSFNVGMVKMEAIR